LLAELLQVPSQPHDPHQGVEKTCYRAQQLQGHDVLYDITCLVYFQSQLSPHLVQSFDQCSFCKNNSNKPDDLAQASYLGPAENGM